VRLSPGAVALAILTNRHYLMSEAVGKTGRSDLDIGEALRRARDARGLSLEQAAQDTRISLRFLEALEDEQFDELPAPVYVRGFTRSYANYLGVDPQPLIDELALRERGGGYAAHPGSGPVYGAPVRPAARAAAPSNPFQPRSPEPARAPANVTAFPAEGAGAAAPDSNDVEADEELDFEDADQDWDRAPADDWPAAQPTAARRSPRTDGLLLEREARAGQGSGRGGLIIAGLVLAGIGAVAAFLLLGGDDDPPLNVDETPTVTATVPGNVIEVRTPTPGGSPVTPIVTASITVVATTTTTPEPTTGTPVPTPTTRVATPTSTSIPSTPTPVPPTPTPTLTPTPVPPTPTPTVVSHPLSYSECIPLSAGELFCGEAPYLVICGPNGWFVDRVRDFPSLGWLTHVHALFICAASVFSAP